MTTEIFLNQTFHSRVSEFDDPGTLVLSTSKMRYRSMQHAKVIQCSYNDCSELFLRAVEEFYADAIIIDLFDDWVKLNPKVIGSFLDAFDDGVYPDTKLYIIIEERSLVNEWEFYHAVTNF